MLGTDARGDGVDEVRHGQLRGHDLAGGGVGAARGDRVRRQRTSLGGRRDARGPHAYVGSASRALGLLGVAVVGEGGDVARARRDHSCVRVDNQVDLLVDLVDGPSPVVEHVLARSCSGICRGGVDEGTREAGGDGADAYEGGDRPTSERDRAPVCAAHAWNPALMRADWSEFWKASDVRVAPDTQATAALPSRVIASRSRVESEMELYSR